MSTGDPSPGAPDPRALIESLFAALAAKNLDGALRCFADDAVLIDPHYPTAHMSGKAAIGDGLRWVFGMMKTLDFSVAHYFPSSEGERAAVEVDTNHLLRSGTQLRFRQVFIIEARGGLLTHVQAFEPYGPSGIGGMLLGLSHLWHRAASSRRSHTNKQ
jgi:ketosteroid isomerase-like protein